MAEKVLIMGESGTGKSTSMRNCNPENVAVVNPVGKPLPFKGQGKFAMLNGVTESRSITKWMKEQAAAGKKIIVVDDFQYILSVPYMNRIKENGWDKWNDFGANYFEIIEVCKELPADVVVYYLTHTETLESGVTTIKLIGKLLREKITIEGLFTIVLRTSVNEGKYYFLTQNSGKDTVKSPLGMFPSYAIDNDLQYVDDKIRNYYELNGAKSDAEIAEADKNAASDLSKPDANGRRSRTARTSKGEADAPAAQKEIAQTACPSTDLDAAAVPQTGERKRRTHDEVEAENQKKMAEHIAAQGEALDKAFPDQEEVPFEEAAKVLEQVEAPELEKVPRRTRKERIERDQAAEEATISASNDQEESPVDGNMNPPETPEPGTRQRRVRRSR